MQLYKSAGEKRPYEIVLIGYDDDKKAHEKYMKKSKMPFAALKMSAKESILKKVVPEPELGYPGLQMMDGDGKLLSKDNDEILKKLAALSTK